MRTRCVVSALAVLAIGLVLVGQTYQERVDVTLVRIDIIATDSQGNPILDLKPSDLRLSVDGRDQPIVALDALAPLPLAATSPTSESSAPAAPSVASPTAIAQATWAPSATYAMAVFVDETSSEQFNRTAVYEELSRFLKKGLPPGNVILLERFDGKLHIDCPWTSDAAKLRDALSEMEKHTYMPRIGQPGRISPAGGAGGTASSPALAYMNVSDVLANSAWALIEAIRTYPPDIARRKSLVVVTDGAPFMTASELVNEIIASSESAADRVPGGSGEGAVRVEIAHDNALLSESAARQPRWFSQMTDATQMALRRDIEIIPARSATFDADAGGLSAESLRRGTSGGNTPISGQALVKRAAEGPGASKAWAASGMEQMASVTGGEAILSRAQVGKTLRDEVDRSIGSYLLIFRDPYVGDHLFHKVEIQAERTKVKLRYRHGYRILSGEDSLAERVVTGLYEPPKGNPLGAIIDVHLSRKSASVADLAVLISFSPVPETLTDVTRRILVVCVSATSDGRRSEPFRIQATGHLQERPEGPIFLVPVRLRIEPSTTSISLGVRDEPTGLTSLFLFRPDS